MSNFYLIATIVSFVALVLFIIFSDRKVLFYNASFFLFALVGNLGYYFLGRSTCVEEALVANKVTYISGCSLSLFLMMLVCDACKIVLPKLVRMVMYGLNIMVLILSMTAGYTDWFYRECRIERVNGMTILVKEYGPWHNLFLFMVYGYLAGGLILLLYSLMKRKNLIYKNVMLLLLLYISTVLCYTVGRKFFHGIDPVCISYSIGDIILLFVTYNTCLYNLDEALLTSVEKQEHQGYLLFDKHFKYFGCNSVAIKFIPELEAQPLAKKIDPSCSEVFERIYRLIKYYNGEDTQESISLDGQDIEISVQYLYKGNKIRGYIVRITDDSRQQEYIRQLDLSKIESGKLEVIPVEYDLADIIYDLETMIRPLIKKDNLEFIISTGSNLPKRLYGDAIRIKQMVTNILTNAV